VEEVLAELIQRATLGDRAAVIGDIHGSAQLLRRLLAKLEDRAIVVAGDVCDRGPDTRNVIDQLIAVDARGVLGNHDLWLRDWACGRGLDDFALHPAMGGRATLESYGATGTFAELEAARWRVPNDHAGWLDSLPLALSIEVAGRDFWVVHAGLLRQLRFPEAVEGRVEWAVRKYGPRMCWGKCLPRACVEAEAPVIMGHVPLTSPEDHGHCIAVDTGAGTWGDSGGLTAVLLPERSFVSVSASSA